MKKIVYILISVFFIGSISSCRPSYMKCPKNRRCVEVKNNNIQTQLPIQINKTALVKKNS